MELSWSDLWQESRQQLKNVHTVLFAYLRQPIEHITRLPDWSWFTLFLVQTSIAAGSGVLSGLVSGSFINTLFGLFIFPITAAVTVLLVGAVIYYAILFFKKREVSFRKIVTITVFANIFYLILRILSPVIPIVDLIGAGVSGAVMIVGFSDTFNVERKFVIRVVAALYALMIFSSVARMIHEANLFSKPKTPVTTESWEILEREINAVDSE